MDGSPQVVRFDATTLWHFDAAEWVPSTASKAETLNLSIRCPLYPRKMGESACQLTDSGKLGCCASGWWWNEVRICGLKHQKEKRSMAYFAGLDGRSRKRASASWMMRTRSCGKRGWRVSRKLSCRRLRRPSIASSELGWKLDRYRNGYSVHS